jgi:hypothetical protein
LLYHHDLRACAELAEQRSPMDTTTARLAKLLFVEKNLSGRHMRRE